MRISFTAAATTAIFAAITCPTATAISLQPAQDRQSTSLAQVFSAAKPNPEVCQISQNRNKAALPDFYSMLESGSVYTDTEFGHSSEALYWASAGEQNSSMASTEGMITWKRAADIEGNHTLFGTDGAVNVLDIRQGFLDNCWFLAAAYALAEKPGRLEKIFLNNSNTLNEAGIYGVNMFTLGVPHTVIVDDWLPTIQNGDGSFDTMSAKVGHDAPLWGPILEKAFAKYHGNYEHNMGGGDPKVAVTTLLGGPSVSHHHQKKLEPWGAVKWAGLTENELWGILSLHDGKDDIILGYTPENINAGRNKDGLLMNHAYIVHGIHTLNNGQKLVKMRNPNGRDYYAGAYSDTSGDWTQALQDEVGYTPSTNDGVFWMTISDYLNQVESTYINFDITDWHEVHHLMLDDTRSNDQYKRFKVKLELTSDVDQTVYFNVYTWDKRGFADICATSRFKHSFFAHTEGEACKYGASETIALEMTAGQRMVPETYWSFDDYEAKDWSMVVWAPGPLGKLTVKEGYESNQVSSSLPYIPNNGKKIQKDAVKKTEVVAEENKPFGSGWTDEGLNGWADESEGRERKERHGGPQWTENDAWN